MPADKVAPVGTFETVTVLLESAASNILCGTFINSELSIFPLAVDELVYTPPAGSTASVDLTFSVPGSGTQTLINTDFNTDAGGFIYSDDAFRSSNEPDYADGAYDGSGGNSSGGLTVDLGGQDNSDINDMSGGWSTTFDVPENASGTLTFDYRLDMANPYEGNEYVEVLASIDGNLHGTNGNDYIDQISGGGDSGWQTVTIDLGSLTAGTHTLTLGGYNNQKTHHNEYAEISFDNVTLTVDGGAPVTADATVTPAEIPLTISSSLVDTDGSESLAIVISGVPTDAALSAGIDNGDGSWSLDASDLPGLTIDPAPGFSGNFQITVQATSTDGSDTASVTETIDVTVNDVAYITNNAPTDLNLSGNGDTFEYVVEHSDPVAFWRLGESSGDTTVVDEMGNHDGTYSQGANSTNGTSPFTGLNNTAANFDGQNDYVEIPNSPDFDLTEGTFHAWFKVDSFDGTDHTILSMDSSGTDGGSMYLAVDSDREDLEFYIEDPSGPSTGYGNNSHVITSADGSISEGVWHQVSVSFGPNGMSMYLDGNLVASDSYTGGIGNADDEPITIGASQRNASTEGQAVSNELDRFFDGQIAEVAIFDNALSQSEINSLIDVGLNAVELTGTNVVEHALPGTVVGTLTTTDPDAGDTFTYNLTDDASGRFEIDTSTGELKVANDAQLDFETQASHSVTVEVTDSAGASYSESFTIDLIDVNEVLGTNGADNVSGTQLADVIHGLAGDDQISGGQGDDSIYGGAGNDQLSGDEGNDQIYGGDGNDSLNGGDGDDLLVGGAGNDVAVGGAGDDTYIFEALGDSDSFSGGDGGGWTDVIELDVDITSQPDPENPWTITVDGNEVSYDVDQGFLDLGPDASGVISFDDGSEINFDGVEQIQW